MTPQEMFRLINENPAFYLATSDGDQPRVRGMLLYRADKNGFIFHTASTKDVFSQIMKKIPTCTQHLKVV
ncbi:MAG: pyridoxamine 5'-phosphate oxidase family protein [Oscillospiraceae bacterium]|nr:pyridoxamine 5'-phosphate oxidase family protein [Oscillospiraceae bacterium]